MNITVPIVASSDLCASGMTAGVHGPPFSGFGEKCLFSGFRFRLTSNDHNIGCMDQTVTGLDTRDFLQIAILNTD